MSARRHSHLRPVIVEVQPDTTTTVPSTAPSSPSKTVRFAHTSENGSSRPLTTIEAWSLYNFEVHARSCSICSRSTRLCDTGDALSKDVACHVFSRNAEIYAVRADHSSKLVRVEIPHGYTFLRQWLQSVERQQKRSSVHKTPLPTSIDYTRVYPITSTSTRRTTFPDDQQNVYIEPAHSSSRRSSRPHHHHRYSTVVANANGDNNNLIENVTVLPVPFPSSSSSQRRGTLYERDAQRRKDSVKIEVREPEDTITSSSGRRRHRRHSVWL